MKVYSLRSPTVPAAKTYERSGPSLAMAEIRRTQVPNDYVDKHAYLGEKSNAKMVDGEAPAPYFETMSTIREKLAEAGIIQADQEANLDVLQCLSSDHALDKILLQYTPNLTLPHVEDRLHKTQRKMDESRKVIDG